MIDKVFALFGLKLDPMQSYDFYAKSLAWWEIIAANVTSCFIAIYSNLVSADFSLVRIIGRWIFSSFTPSDYLSEAEEQQKPLAKGNT